MSKFVSFASDLRLNALLCSSAAVLLTACGGNVDSGAADPRATQAAATTVVGSAAPEQAVQSEVPVAEAGVEAAAGPANFDLIGYENSAVAEEGATPSVDLAEAGADIKTTIPVTTYKYYVAPTGSDTNAGTATSPWKTLARAARSTKASTTVFVAPGTYAGGLKTTISGSSTGHIYFVSTTKGGARIVPPSSSVNSTAWDNRGNYVEIIGFNVDGTTSGSGTKWLHGIYNGGSYGVIRDNHIHHIAKSVTCTSAGGSAIGVDSYYHGMMTDVINNVVNDIGPTGCRYIQGIYMSTSGRVINNLVYRVAEAGIHLWHDATKVVITNNTVTTSHTGIVIGGGDFYYTAGPDDYTHVHNNIVYDNYYGISEQGKTGVHNTYQNNLVNGNTINWTLKNGLTHTGTVNSNPLFMAYSRTATPNLHLTSSSPAIGRGTSSYAYPTDIDGRPRNSTTGFDIGAYQH